MARGMNLPCALCTAALLLAACGDESASDNGQASERELEVAMSALENPIISCQLQAGECVQKASDLAALQACQAGIGDCLRAAGERIQKIADGVSACRDQERMCVRKKGASCFGDFQQCVQSLGAAGDGGAPSAPPVDAGVPADAAADDGGTSTPSSDAATPPSDDGGSSTPPSTPPDAGFSGFPSPFPGFGDGGRSGLPSFPGLPGGGGSFGGSAQLPGGDCLMGLRECAAKPGADLFDCADNARECLRGGARSPLPFP